MYNIFLLFIGIKFFIAGIILQVHTLNDPEWIRTFLIRVNDINPFPEHKDGYAGPSDYTLRKYQYAAFITIPSFLLGIILFIIRIVVLIQS